MSTHGSEGKTPLAWILGKKGNGEKAPVVSLSTGWERPHGPLPTLSPSPSSPGRSGAVWARRWLLARGGRDAAPLSRSFHSWPRWRGRTGTASSRHELQGATGWEVEPDGRVGEQRSAPSRSPPLPSTQGPPPLLLSKKLRTVLPSRMSGFLVTPSALATVLNRSTMYWGGCLK